MDKKKVFIAAAVLILVLSGIYAAFSSKAPVGEYFTVSAPEQGKGILAVGKVKSSSSSELIAEVNGRILESAPSESDIVSTGDIIFKIDSSGYDQILAQKKASYDNAAAQYKYLLESRLPDAKQEMLQSESEKNVAKKAYDDAVILHEAGAMSQSGLDDARLAYESAEAKYDSAAREYMSLSDDGAMIRQEKAALESARAELNNALNQKSKYTVASPQNGILLKKNAEAGSYVQIGQSLAHIGDLQDLYISAELDERYFSYVKTGMKAFAFIDEDTKYESGITSVSPLVDEDTGSFTIRLSLDPSFPYKASELTINIEILPDSDESVFSLPASYILEDGNDRYVWKYEAGRIQKTPIQQGPSYPGQATAVSGIGEGDILIGPQPGFMDGDKVSLEK